MIVKIFLLCNLYLLLNAAEKLNVKVWQSKEKYPDRMDFPESNKLQSKPNTAIAIAGGGARAFAAGIGYLSALTELDLIKNVRYIGGISGGGWATVVYTYAQNVTDEQLFLGSITPPHLIRREELQKMDPNCALSFTSARVETDYLKAFATGNFKTFGEAWVYTVSNAYMEPVKIEAGRKFAWDEDSVNEIKAANPSLINDTFHLPRQIRSGSNIIPGPYPIIGMTLSGPKEGGSYNQKNHNFTLLEVTPDYIGQLRTLDVQYDYHTHPGRTHTIRVGGLIQPFGFAISGGSPPTRGLSSSQTSGVVQMDATDLISIDLQNAIGTGSFAVGSLLESLPAPAADKLGLVMEYWSPTESILPSQRTTFFTDGGNFENIALISFLQRRVSRIVLFYVSSVPLTPSNKWNVTETIASGDFQDDQATDDLEAFFGAIDPTWPTVENRTYDYSMNQVFALDDYERVILGLQEAQQSGGGIVATFNLTTVENVWWGIPAGFEVEITFSYLGRCKTWEKKLSKEMQELVIPQTYPDDGEEDLSYNIEEGPFRSFPNYATTAGDINSERSNLLANLAGWSVLNNAEIFKRKLRVD